MSIKCDEMSLNSIKLNNTILSDVSPQFTGKKPIYFDGFDCKTTQCGLLITNGGFTIVQDESINKFSNVTVCKIWYKKETKIAHFSQIDLNCCVKTSFVDDFRATFVCEIEDVKMFRRTENSFFFFSDELFFGYFCRLNNDKEIINNFTIHGQIETDLMEKLFDYCKSN